LNIRNPWGEKEWDGDWSDTSSLWTKEMKAHFKPSLDQADGTFWMDFETFCKNFIKVNVCKLENYKELRFKCDFSVQEDESSYDDDGAMQVVS